MAGRLFLLAAARPRIMTIPEACPSGVSQAPWDRSQPHVQRYLGGSLWPGLSPELRPNRPRR
jgi:hypothetical protein